MVPEFQANPPPVRLRSLFPSAQFLHGSDVVGNAITTRLDEVGPGVIFAGIRGVTHDGAIHAAEAARRGAAGCLLSTGQPQVTLPQCLVPHPRAAFGRVCAELAGEAARLLPVVGITGTNGKSTTAWMIRWLMNSTGRRCGLLGTIEYDDGAVCEPASLTTPDTRMLWTWLTRMSRQQAAAAAIELSSHALHQDRAASVNLAAAIVTNVTHDHLDYHGNFDDYWLSKFRIFEQLRPDGVAVLNLDDAGSARMRSRLSTSVPQVTCSQSIPADFRAHDAALSLSGSAFVLQTPLGTRPCRLPLTGRHNIDNALAAVAAAVHLGLSLEEIIEGLRTFPGVPGRLEPVDAGQPFSLFVDYAHTDDALSHCLRTLRALTPGRLLCVFGAGGDRDRSKRPKLGAAATLADIAIVTSDNPRREPPERILAEIVAGMSGCRTAPLVEPDREAAIFRAVELAEPGDCVVIAGKGHEQVQIVGETQFPFDDRAVARRCLLRLQDASTTNRRRISA